MQRTWVWSLVGKLRSHVPCSQKGNIRQVLTSGQGLEGHEHLLTLQMWAHVYVYVCTWTPSCIHIDARVYVCVHEWHLMSDWKWDSRITFSMVPRPGQGPRILSPLQHQPRSVDDSVALEFSTSNLISVSQGALVSPPIKWKFGDELSSEVFSSPNSTSLQ